MRSGRRSRSVSRSPARCSRGTSACRPGCTATGYLQCALVLQHPATSPRRSAARSATRLRASAADGRAVAGARRPHHRPRGRRARSASARSSPSARTAKLTLRRGFTLDAADRVVVIEDVVTTGGSTRETIGGRRSRRRAGRRRRRDHRSQRRDPARARRCRSQALVTPRASPTYPARRVPAVRAGASPVVEAGLELQA